MTFTRFQTIIVPSTTGRVNDRGMNDPAGQHAGARRRQFGGVIHEKRSCDEHDQQSKHRRSGRARQYGHDAQDNREYHDLRLGETAIGIESGNMRKPAPA